MITLAKSMIINATDTTGATTTSAITNVNPNATNGELIALAQGLNGLTKNTYRGATLVEKTDLVAKPESPVTIDKSTVSVAAIKSEYDSVSFLINGTDTGFDPANTPKVIKNNTGLCANVYQVDFKDSIGLRCFIVVSYPGQLIDATNFLYDAYGNLIDTETGEIVVQIPETTQYAAKTLTITVTA